MRAQAQSLLETNQAMIDGGGYTPARYRSRWRA